MIFLGETDADDCAQYMDSLKLSDVENTLKSMTDVKPKVLEDFRAIREKYPCNYHVLRKLALFVSNSIKFFM